MQAILDRILTVNLLFTTLIFYLTARIYLLPKLRDINPKSILIPILILHSMRHLGLMFLTPGAVYPGMPPQFAWPAALGDLLAALLAVSAIPAVLKMYPVARLQVWIFNVVGTVDLVLAISLATLYQAPLYMGASYWIPAFWVPALLVTHYIVYVILGRWRA